MNYKFSAGDIMTAAEAKVGIKGWKAYRWEDCDGDSIVTGDVPDGVYRSAGAKVGRDSKAQVGG